MDFLNSFVYGGVLGMIATAFAIVVSTMSKNSRNNAVSEEKDEIRENSTKAIEQIQKLADLKERGIITKEEFKSKKQELLEKI